MSVSYSNETGWLCYKHGVFDGGPEHVRIDAQDTEGYVPQQIPWPECPKCKHVSDNKLCVECERKPATVTFAQDTMSYIHGMTEMICRGCYYDRVKKNFEETSKNFKKMHDEMFPEKDNLIGDSESFNKNVRYYRAGGDRICDVCKVSYYDHPVVRLTEKRHYNCELHVLCNGDRVKL